MAYFDQRQLAGPDPRPFQLPPPDETFRIVFVGASTVEGFPYYTELAFPRQVELLLQQQLPNRRIEVLNAAIVGINSFALADFVPRALRCEPDLVVLYAGHNEFYGPGGVGSTATVAPMLYGVIDTSAALAAVPMVASETAKRGATTTTDCGAYPKTSKSASAVRNSMRRKPITGNT